MREIKVIVTDKDGTILDTAVLRLDEDSGVTQVAFRPLQRGQFAQLDEETLVIGDGK